MLTPKSRISLAARKDAARHKKTQSATVPEAYLGTKSSTSVQKASFVQVVWVDVPAGTYQMRFRLRAAIVGSFTAPPGEAETMYRNDVYGASAGTQLIVTRP